MRTPRRSWFHRPRWWVTIPVTALWAFGLSEVLAPATGERFGADLGGRALMAGVVAVGSSTSDRRSSRRWEELESSSSVSDAERVAAEGVVREGVPAASEPVRREAVRIATLRWEELRTARSVGAPIAGVLGLVSAVAGVLPPPWWLVPSVLCWWYVVWVCLSVRRLGRRRGELMTASTVTTGGADGLPPRGGRLPG